MKACIIVGITARQLARSATKAGVEVLALDLFGDLDTQMYSSRSVRLMLNGAGFDGESLFAALDEVDPDSKYPVVYGGGFEGHPAQLDEISKHRRLLGNSAEQVSRIRDFCSFSEFLTEFNIPFPETQLQPPSDSRKWLRKDIRGTGGSDVSWLSQSDLLSDFEYHQLYIEGRTITATVLATKNDAQVIGFSEQWNASNVQDRPFFYGGAASIALNEIPKQVEMSIRQAAKTIVDRYELRGLITLDTIVKDNQWYLLEVNPRPGSTAELHEHDSTYFQAHCDAFDDAAQTHDLHSATQKNVFVAQSIIYASDKMWSPKNWSWESWVTDIPSPGDLYSRGDPVCSVVASAASSDEAKQLVNKRHKATTKRLKQWEIQA